MVCGGTGLWRVMDVGNADLCPGERGHFDSGGCSVVCEQLPDRADEVGLCQSRPYQQR